MHLYDLDDPESREKLADLRYALPELLLPLFLTHFRLAIAEPQNVFESFTFDHMLQVLARRAKRRNVHGEG